MWESHTYVFYTYIGEYPIRYKLHIYLVFSEVYLYNSKMGRRECETTIEERKIILNLHNENKCYSQIAKVMNRSKFTI